MTENPDDLCERCAKQMLTLDKEVNYRVLLGHGTNNAVPIYACPYCDGEAVELSLRSKEHGSE